MSNPVSSTQKPALPNDRIGFKPSNVSENFLFLGKTKVSNISHQMITQRFGSTGQKHVDEMSTQFSLLTNEKVHIYDSNQHEMVLRIKISNTIKQDQIEKALLPHHSRTSNLRLGLYKADNQEKSAKQRYAVLLSRSLTIPEQLHLTKTNQQNRCLKLELPVTAQKPLADSTQTPPQPSTTVTNNAENEDLPVKMSSYRCVAQRLESYESVNRHKTSRNIEISSPLNTIPTLATSKEPKIP